MWRDSGSVALEIAVEFRDQTGRPHGARLSASVYEICMHDFRSLDTRMNIHEINVEFVFIFSWLKGVLHPRSVFGLFLHFSQKLQHIGSK